MKSKLLSSLFLLAAILLASCSNATITSTPHPTGTEAAITLTPPPASTETPIPTPAEFDYSIIDLNERGTWNTEFSTTVNGETTTINPAEYYASLSQRQVAEKGSALEKQYIKQDQAFHIFMTNSISAFLKSQGIDVAKLSNQELLDYSKSIKIYESYWQWQTENYQNTGEYAPLASDPWLFRGDGKTNLGMYGKDNLVVNSYESGGYTLNNMSKTGLISFLNLKPNVTDAEVSAAFSNYIAQLSTDKIPLFGIKNLRYWLPFTNKPAFFNLAGFVENPNDPTGTVIMMAKFGDGKYRPFLVNLKRNQIDNQKTFVFRGDNDGLTLNDILTFEQVKAIQNPFFTGTFFTSTFSDHPDLDPIKRKVLNFKDIITLLGKNLNGYIDGGAATLDGKDSIGSNGLFIDGLDVFDGILGPDFNSPFPTPTPQP